MAANYDKFMNESTQQEVPLSICDVITIVRSKIYSRHKIEHVQQHGTILINFSTYTHTWPRNLVATLVSYK
jgi:hypothetical protein